MGSGIADASHAHKGRPGRSTASHSYCFSSFALVFDFILVSVVLEVRLCLGVRVACPGVLIRTESRVQKHMLGRAICSMVVKGTLGSWEWPGPWVTRISCVGVCCLLDVTTAGFNNHCGAFRVYRFRSCGLSVTSCLVCGPELWNSSLGVRLRSLCAADGIRAGLLSYSFSSFATSVLSDGGHRAHCVTLAPVSCALFRHVLCPVIVFTHAAYEYFSEHVVRTGHCFCGQDEVRTISGVSRV